MIQMHMGSHHSFNLLNRKFNTQLVGVTTALALVMALQQTTVY